MIHAFKFEYMHSMVSGLSKYLVLAYEQYYTHEQIDLILPVPLHKSRLRQREFNQAHLLAKHFADDVRIPLRDGLVVRNRSTQPQSHLKPDERMKNVKDAFSIRNPDEVNGKTILIIDDIVTTGSTVNEMSKVLRECGATRILVLSLAIAYT
jgi:ComF family protein